MECLVLNFVLILFLIRVSKVTSEFDFLDDDERERHKKFDADYPYLSSYQEANPDYKHVCFTVWITTKKTIALSQCITDHSCNAPKVSDQRIVSSLANIYEPEEGDLHTVKHFVVHPHCKYNENSKLWENNFVVVYVDKSNRQISTSRLALWSQDPETLRIWFFSQKRNCSSIGFLTTEIKGGKPKKNKFASKFSLKVLLTVNCITQFCVLGLECQSVPMLRSIAALACAKILLIDKPTQAQWNDTSTIEAWYNGSGSPLICDKKLWGLSSIVIENSTQNKSTEND